MKTNDKAKYEHARDILRAFTHQHDFTDLVFSEKMLGDDEEPAAPYAYATLGITTDDRERMRMLTVLFMEVALDVDGYYTFCPLSDDRARFQIGLAGPVEALEQPAEVQP